jgi:hypothetical protein
MHPVGDLGTIFVLALLAMLNPTLLAAATVMMLLPDTRRLMLGYLLGAYLASISLGLLIVFSLNGSASVSTARRTLSPAEDLVFGALALIVGLVLRSGRVEEARERRRRRRESTESKRESWPERMLGRGSARVSFAVGVVLTLPGVSYLAGLDRIAKLDATALETTLLVVVFCLIQQMLLELPLIGYWLAPDSTQDVVARFRGWLERNGRRAAATGATAIGALLIVRGVVELVA